jgi:uroporphyrinogen-III decarboxylase
LVDFYDRWYRKTQAANDQVVSGGYYNTLVSGAIQIFGWEMLLEAMGEDADRFGEEVLGSIFAQNIHHFKAWADTSIEVFMCHDDMVWTEGPFANPDFYRQYIFPRYKALWQPLKDAGKRVLFTSDGTYDMFYDDIAAAGADGFCFEPTNDLRKLVAQYGQTHVIMGGADCRTLTFGTREEIKRELRDIFTLARDCPGFVFATGNHLPANIPLDNAIRYFELVEELGKR